MLDSIRKAVLEAEKNRHRRLILLSGEVNRREVIEFLKGEVVKDFGALYVCWEPDHEIAKVLKEFEWVEPDETDKVLGTTWDMLICEEPQDLSPNALGRLVETVRGGGIILFLTASMESWGEEPADYHRRIVSPPYTLEDVKRRFTLRLKRKMLMHDGIIIVKDGKVVYDSSRYDHLAGKDHSVEASDALEALARSSDQLKALRLMGRLGKVEGRAVLVIRADRGRGKSAALGLGIAKLLGEGGIRDEVLLTAPSSMGISQVFEFIERGLKVLNIRYLKKGREIKVGKAKVGFVSPYVLSHRKGRWAFIDEAAGIPLPLLLKYLNTYEKLVYSSTVHGYEGSGRGFGIRFMKRLRELKDLEVFELEMSEPIRYADGDPIERWLYDVLLLDSEPDKVEPSEPLKDVEYRSVDRDFYFEEGEDRLRAFIGTYVTAHYRNRPDDLILLGEAPHHFARTLSLPDGRILVALHLAREGSLGEKEIEGMVEGELPPGHLIPGVLLKYYPVFKYFGVMRGVRIVRIATNPSLFGRGFGSLALKRLEEEMRHKVDWLGASFGASKELVGFWSKNGYVPVHISPMRNAASGEYSVIMIKPLTRKAKSYIREISREFRQRLFDSLHDTYYSLPIDVALQLFKGFEMPKLSRAKLSEAQKGRLDNYIKGEVSYEACSDVIRELLRAHLFTDVNRRLGIPERVEKGLAAKCLQGRSWKYVMDISNLKDPHEIFRRYVERMRRYYLGG